MAEATSGLVGEPGGNPSASMSQAFDLGYQEIQLQVWGQDAKTMYGVGQDIAAIDSKVVVKVPMTGDGAAVAARLKRQKAIVTCTAIYSARQALAAVGLGADYLAPYLGRMNNAGRNVSPSSLFQLPNFRYYIELRKRERIEENEDIVSSNL